MHVMIIDYSGKTDEERKMKKVLKRGRPMKIFLNIRYLRISMKNQVRNTDELDWKVSSENEQT
ncbi:hypothetical protein PRIPAC_70478, partial [Pristionchus pacificus]|uniref:Uncharacterized protein n=1 Tax=Pristionchus pacificus TaxID=54126 RepID=A0A2A6C0W1_PRIPA